MNQEPNLFSSSKVVPPIKIDLDEFLINEDSFKPMTKGLGFHQETKRSSFKPSLKPSFKPAPMNEKSEVKSSFPKSKNKLENSVQKSLSSLSKTTVAIAQSHSPSGLEAFYSNTKSQAVTTEIAIDKTEFKAEKTNKVQTAPSLSQLLAWLIDVAVVGSFVVLTGALLVLASGIELKLYSRLVSAQDLILFGMAIFSIYYLLYFTVLDLSSSPGKTVMGIKLVKTDDGEITVRHTFLRAFISLLSGVALFLPMLLDFQGRLSDTRVVK